MDRQSVSCWNLRAHSGREATLAHNIVFIYAFSFLLNPQCEARGVAQGPGGSDGLNGVGWNFHFACPATREYTPECPALHLFRIRSNGEDPVVPAGP
jgi:hypothetical protein